MVKSIYLYIIFAGLFFSCNNDKPRTSLTNPIYPIPDSTVESLQRYSYHMMGYNDSALQFKGTGFFVRYNNKIFFVTAKHTVVPYNTDCIPFRKPDIWTIFLPDGGLLNPLEINVNVIKDTVKCPYPADVIAIEINNPKNYKIHYMEFSSPSELPKTLGEISIDGFQGLNNITVLNNITHFYSTLSIINQVDSFNYIVTPTGISITDSLRGLSGAPTFLQDSTTKKWAFLGTLVKIDTAKKELYLVRAEAIFNEIKRYQ